MIFAVCAAVALAVSAAVSFWLLPRLRPPDTAPAWWATGLVSAVLAVAYAAVLSNPAAVLVAALLPVLIVVASIDGRTLRIPNGLTAVAAVVVAAAALWVFPAGPGWYQAAVAAAVAATVFIILLAMNLFAGLGMGDVKLAPVIAAGLLVVTAALWPSGAGYFLVPVLFAAVVTFWLTISFALAAVRVLVLRSKGHFAFGPFLVAGSGVILVFLPEIAGLAAGT